MLKNIHILAAAAAMALSAAVWGQELVVKPGSITHTRVSNLNEGDSFGLLSNLAITLRIEGSSAKAARKFGRLKVAEALDDKGNDLRPEPTDSDMSNEDHLEFTHHDLIMRTDPFSEPDAAIGFRVEVRLAAPSRDATVLRSLKGEFQMITGGDWRDVVVKNPEALIGKKLDHPALSEAGVVISVAKPAKITGIGASMDQIVGLTISGNRDVVDSIVLLNGGGKQISKGWYSSSERGVDSLGIIANEALDANTAVKITLNVGQQTVTVPFELKDVKLP
jgi:hypothetical protein